MLGDHEGIYLGFDPGGDCKFGVALLNGNCVKTSTVSTVDDAMKWAVEAVDACGARKPIAAGIDTLLHWATSRSGLRPCDLKLRKKYVDVKGNIVAPNGLFGAMAIGGMALALRLRQKWPELVLNETHPKVLLHALSKRWPKIKKEHARDAAISAWATQKGMGVAEGWIDIIGDGDKLLFPAGKVRYMWPNALD